MCMQENLIWYIFKESPYLSLLKSDKVGTDLCGREFGFNILLSFLFA